MRLRPNFIRATSSTLSTTRAYYNQRYYSQLLHTQPFTTSKFTGANCMPTIPFFHSLFGRSITNSSKMSYPVQKTDDEWRAVLNKEQFRILREKGTEAPFTGQFDKHMPSAGVYTCAGCNVPLYRATHKFKSGCGWPAFFDALPGAVTRHVDRGFGMERTEIVCSNCGGHLGHVFKGEGYPTPTDERHCVNSVSLSFISEDPIVEGERR